MNNYFVLNRETRKLELHFTKEMYASLSDEQKESIKSNFLWGRKSQCWISRAKEPNLHFARRCAESLGLEDAGQEGERISFAEQMERKSARAERRADIYEGRADAAEQRGEALQKPINDMRGDISFFTQPVINSAAGRAFARRRDRMFAAFDRGFEEFRKSEYWQGRAATARATADKRDLQDKGFVGRRIAEREADIRKLKKNVEAQERTISRIENGEAVTNWRGEPVELEKAQENLEYWLDRLEAKLDELGFYQECMEKLGGVQFSKANLKRGDLVYVSRWKEPVRFIRGGSKNFTYEFTVPHMTYANGQPMQGQAAYAEIKGRVEEKHADADGEYITPEEFAATVTE